MGQRSPLALGNLPVLIVDDNATNRHILHEWLRTWQMNPTAVGDGMEAMDALWHGVASGRPYALVLLDLCMPDIDGLTLAAKIRQRAELSSVRIILLTSGDRPGDLARSRELRIAAQLLKPVPQDDLLATIYRVMSQTNGDGQAVREPAKAMTRTVTPLRILVAEDNEFNTRHLERLLTRRGHHVQLAGNGREALEALGIRSPSSGVRSSRTTDFDLLLLDLHMPELDGFQVIAAIRECERLASWLERQRRQKDICLSSP